MTQPFQFANGQVAYSKEDLLELCKQHPDDATNYLIREDFEKWLAYIGDYQIAECATSARQTNLEDRQKLEEFLNRSYSLTVPEPVPAAVSEAPIEVGNQPKADSTEIVEQPSKPEAEVNKDSEAVESTTVEEPKKPIADLSTKTPESAKDSDTNDEKLSFFQVIAKFIVNILYRNKK